MGKIICFENLEFHRTKGYLRVRNVRQRKGMEVVGSKEEFGINCTKGVTEAMVAQM